MRIDQCLRKVAADRKAAIRNQVRLNQYRLVEPAGMQTCTQPYLRAVAGISGKACQASASPREMVLVIKQRLSQGMSCVRVVEPAGGSFQRPYNDSRTTDHSVFIYSPPLKNAWRLWLGQRKADHDKSCDLRVGPSPIRSRLTPVKKLRVRRGVWLEVLSCLPSNPTSPVCRVNGDRDFL